jgi:outer membrane protein
MRNLSWILNIVLLLAVTYLFYLHFKGNSIETPSNTEVPKTVTLSTAQGIVFVNSDSLLNKYDFYKNKKKEFEDAQESIKRELKTESERLQKDMEQYQQQGGAMTEQQRAQVEEQLTMRQQKLLQKKDMMVEKLDEEQSKSSDELYVKLNEYFTRYNKDHNYSYILGFQKGGGILFANDSLNITSEIIEGLNKEYSGGKK